MKIKETLMSFLIINRFYAQFQGHFFDNKMHRHHAIQICSCKDEELAISIGKETISGNDFIIAPDYPHQIIRGTGELKLLFIDPETNIGKEIISEYLKSEPYVKLINDNIFGELEFNKNIDKDPRVAIVLDLIDRNPINKVKIEDLAKKVNLSESRLQHIFKENIGIPIKKYLLWRKVGYAVHLSRTKNDLTWIAHEAGFSDSPHFSRTFKKMFGVRLKDVFAKSAQVDLTFNI